MKKIKYRNNNYNNQMYSINYKFDSSSPAGKCSGTALDLIKKYNELAKEAQGNGNYVEAEVFRQYAEHYRKIITEINERKNARFANKNEENVEQNKENVTDESSQPENSSAQDDNVSVAEKDEKSDESKQDLVVTKPRNTKKSFTVIEVADDGKKKRRASITKQKKESSEVITNA